MEQDKTFLGTEPIGKLLMKLAVPTVIAQLVNMLYNIIDRVYIGHIPGEGSMALTGVGVCMPLILIIAAFAALVGSGGSPRASIYMGKGEHDTAEKILTGCLSLQIIVSIILTVILLIWNENLLLMFGASENTSRRKRHDLRVDFRLEWRPDTLTTIIFRPSGSYSKTDSENASGSDTWNNTHDPVNAKISSSSSNSNNYSLNGNLMMFRRLNNKGRNIHVGARFGYSDSETDSYSESSTEFFELDSIISYATAYMNIYAIGTIFVQITPWYEYIYHCPGKSHHRYDDGSDRSGCEYYTGSDFYLRDAYGSARRSTGNRDFTGFVLHLGVVFPLREKDAASDQKRKYYAGTSAGSAMRGTWCIHVCYAGQ